MNLRIASASTLLSSSAPSDCFLFSDLKRMLALNEEVIAKTEVYFQAKKKSYYKNGITILEGRNSQCITLERNYVRKKIIIIST